MQIYLQGDTMRTAIPQIAIKNNSLAFLFLFDRLKMNEGPFALPLLTSCSE